MKFINKWGVIMKISKNTIIVIIIVSPGFMLALRFMPIQQTEQIDELIRQRIESAGIPPDIVIGEDRILASIKFPQFYERRTFQPAWFIAKGPILLVQDLINAIENAASEGLDPQDYHLARIKQIFSEIQQNKRIGLRPNPERWVDLDLLCTDAFLVYGAHLLSGKVNPETLDPNWLANRRDGDLSLILDEALSTKAIQRSLDRLLPNHTGYGRLKKALSQFRIVSEESGWLGVTEGASLRRGDRDERVAALRRHLIASGFNKLYIDTDQSYFDETLESAVISFQRTHGLDVDGVVGPATLAELNVNVRERIAQIVVNMERWRWLPQKLGECYILVNIASFELDVVEDDRSFMTMRIVVGKPYRKTPVFSDMVTYLVFNPYWTVPKTIATQDVLPAVRKSVSYLTERNIRVYQGWGADATEVDPNKVDWSNVSTATLPYRFRQDPGPLNALGRIKFMFPNKFDVYMHDTPTRELFAKSERTFSSGCIRIENPMDLAEYLLRSDSKWSRRQILLTLEKGIEETVRLPIPMPIHILYWTAWADEDGSIQFRKDVYGRDKPLLEALIESPFE
jgi:murein L,D-transpeptidase YcbB/YkuD